jgi:hypothetical protein
MTTHRFSDLLGSRVVDAAGNDVGIVHDAVAVQDGPVEVGFGALLRVDALHIGGNGFAARLGYTSDDVKGPWMLKVLFRFLLRRGVEVPWSMVERWDGDVVRLKPEWSGSATRR